MSAPVDEGGPSRFVLTRDAVRGAIGLLTGLTIHETFPAFLHLRRRAALLGRFTDLQPDWKGEVHQWLEMPGGPPNKPHFRPFRSRGSSLNQFWMADNLAGSYAVKSLRGMKDLYVDGDEKFSLPLLEAGDPNPMPILQRLLDNRRVEAWAVAAFLFRNHEFLGEIDGEPEWSELLTLFQDHFEWTDIERNALFTWEVPIATQCFEEWNLSE